MGIITRIEDLIRKAKSEGIPFNTITVSTKIIKSIDRHFFFLQDPIDKSTGLKIKKFDGYEVIEDKDLPHDSIKVEMREKNTAYEEPVIAMHPKDAKRITEQWKKK